MVIVIDPTTNTIITTNADNPVQAAWPLVPLEQTLAPLSPFPLPSLPPTIRDYVVTVAEHTQTHPDMAAMMALGALAICAQGTYEIESKPGYREPLNLYISIYANPGKRKSAVLKLMTRAIVQYCFDHNIRRIADDCTPEALTSLLSQNNGNMALVSAEGGIMDHMAGRYSGTPNIDVYLKAYCGDPIHVDRVGRSSESIQHPTLSIMMASQPEVLRRVMANDTFAGRGLLARFLYCVPPSKLGSRVFDAPDLDGTIADRYRLLITNLLAQSESTNRRILTLSPDACQLIKTYFAAHEAYMASDGQVIADWGYKYIGTLLRIAGLLHLADGNNYHTPVTASTLSAAIDIGKYLMAQAEYAYGLSGYTPIMAQAQLIRARIIKHGIRMCKRSELHAKCRGRDFKKAEDMQPALDLLEEHGYIRMTSPTSSGPGRKPDTVIVVNPAVFG